MIFIYIAFLSIFHICLVTIYSTSFKIIYFGLHFILLNAFKFYIQIYLFCRFLLVLYMCNELGVMGSKVNLTQNMNRHNPMNV